MTFSLTVADATLAVTRIRVAAEAFASELNEADARLGDGDLGITVSNGWRRADESLRNEKPEDIGGVFLVCARAFQETSASSFGTLAATGLMAAAKICIGKTEIPLANIPQLLHAAVTAMAKRGKAQLGDKTVLDALDAIAKAAATKSDPAGLRQGCVSAAADAAARFSNQSNKVGRARMFGDGSIGIVDPGMLAVQRLTESILV